MSSSTVTSLLFPQSSSVSIVAEVIGADATATTFALGCTAGVEGNRCGEFSDLITLGPWASETLAPGAPETGAYDEFINLTEEEVPYTYSVHCDMSRTHALACTTFNNGTQNNDQPTSTITGSEELSSYGYTDFVYYPVTITAGLELLQANNHTGDYSTTGATPTSAPETETETGGSDADATATETATGTDAAGATETPGAAASCAARVFTAMSVAGAALGLIMS